MKEKLQKLLCLVLSLSTILMFSSCGNALDEDAAYDVVSNYLDAVLSFDLETASEYVAEASVRELPFDNINNFIDTVITDLAASSPAIEDCEKELSDALKDISDTISASFDYTIDNIEATENGYIVSVTLEYVEVTDEALAKMSLSFIEKAGNIQLEFKDVIDELIADGTLSENSTEEEIQAALMPEMLKAFTDFIIPEIEQLPKTKLTTDYILIEEDEMLVITNDDISIIIDMLELLTPSF